MKYFIIFAFSLSLSAQTPSTELFRKLLNQHKLTPVSEQAFCYRDEDQEIIGLNVQKKQRLASVTKLFTTLLVAKQADLNQKYVTRFYIDQNVLYIQGGKDPYFEEEKMFFLLQELNNLGFTHFEKIVFDRNFLFADDALGTFERMTSARVQRKISEYFNSDRYSAEITQNLRATRAFYQDEGFDFDLVKSEMNVSEVIYVANIDDLVKNLNPLIHESRPLKDILKSMNAMSKNWISEHLFNEFGGEKKLQQILLTLIQGKETFLIKNGSGLPIEINGPRFDNWATCETVIRMLEELKSVLEEKNLEITEIIAHGSDKGTLLKRFLKDEELKFSIVAKTGTLKHTSTLAGFISFESVIPFAILNHHTNRTLARKFQDDFLNLFAPERGRVIPFTYERLTIFPLSQNTFFQRFN